MRLEAQLTSCEKEVAGYLANGYAKKEVAGELEKSIRTVENLTASAYRKIGIQKVNELVKWWFMVHFNITQSDIEAKRILEVDLKKKAMGLVFVSLLFANDMKFLPACQMARTNTRKRTTVAAPSGKRRNELDCETELYS